MAKKPETGAKTAAKAAKKPAAKTSSTQAKETPASSVVLAVACLPCLVMRPLPRRRIRLSLLPLPLLPD